MQVAIIAGGLATRLGEITKKIPKSMIPIAGKPFLHYQIELLRKAGIYDIVLCIGHLGEQIESYFGDGSNYDVNIAYSYEKGKLLGTGGALKNAAGLLQDKFFTLYGDSYVNLDFSAVMSYFMSFNKLALMTIFKNYGRYDTSNIAIEGNLIRQYGSRNKNDNLVYIDYGVSLFRKKVLDLVPADSVYPMGDIFKQLIEREELLAFEVPQRFYQIGSPEGLRELTELIEGKNKI